MRERPILFSGPMVRAILGDRKTQTRRVIDRLSGFGPISEFGVTSTHGWDWTFRDKQARWNDLHHDRLLSACPYGKTGDRLWVKETTRSRYLPNILTGEPTDALCGEYTADSEPVLDAHEFDLSWWYSRDVCPSIHMPRWASRITLEITGVRVERLQDISEADAEAEGIDHDYLGRWADYKNIRNGGYFDHPIHGAWLSYSSLWESINGPGSWTANPYVWVIEFRRIEGAQA